MSVTRQVTIWCDNCANWEQFSLTVIKARRELKRQGWIRTRDRGDLCRSCSEDNKEDDDD